ncbi:hypothetical protein TcasGA2_TC030951 [Tribolium castaneum]|uniref:Uncharacterized protein n=1 Tax=Tribolium castaneum TaxID=7070 RepID=A0A139WAE9_TRICA|nr:hypothetical protein TcasGA2_TC030951 [Tribolium castaneum]
MEEKLNIFNFSTLVLVFKLLKGNEETAVLKFFLVGTNKFECEIIRENSKNVFQCVQSGS